MSILDTIIDYKKTELVNTKIKTPFSDLKSKISEIKPTRDFTGALSTKGLQVIAEVKPASPSKGVICADCDPVEVASIYEKNGAAAISVLTEKKYFGGSLENLVKIRQAVGLPLLRKDFIFDPYQIYEARIAGADAILLIAASLDKTLLEDLYGLALELGLAVLPEIHNYRELDMVLRLDPSIIGINNRNLQTMEISLETTINLLGDIPKGKLVVSESGIRNRDHAAKMAQAGVAAVLVGEVLMQAENVAAKLKEIRLAD